MFTLFLLLWGMVSARIKSTNLDYRMVQQLDGLKRLVKLNEGVVATCNLVLIPQPVNYRYHHLRLFSIHFMGTYFSILSSTQFPLNHYFNSNHYILCLQDSRGELQKF